jgi:hypothetical protein
MQSKQNSVAVYSHLLAAQHHSKDVGVHDRLQIVIIRLKQRPILVCVGARVVDPQVDRAQLLLRIFA